MRVASSRVFTGSVVNALDPSCIVYGGGLIEAAGPYVLPIIRETAYRHLIRPVDPEQLPILEAALGDDAVAIGAAMLARVGSSQLSVDGPQLSSSS